MSLEMKGLDSIALFMQGDGGRKGQKMGLFFSLIKFHLNNQ